MKLSTLRSGLQYQYSTVIIVLFTSLHSFSQIGWVQVPSPNPSASRNMVGGISGTSSSDVWAVGSYEEIVPYNPYNIENDLLLHWNGNAWQQFPAMQLSTTLDDLWDVEAISSNNVWAVGNYNDFATTRAELLHYDGNSWTNQPLPFITGGSYLYAIDALSATDIWAAGGQAGSPTRPAYVIRYNGSSWSEIPVPIVGTYRNAFNDIDGISSNDIWAVGHWGNASGQFHALAMHWNGSNWSNISLPSSIVSPLSEVLNVKMIASNDVWAIGYYLAGGGFMIHWDGSTWTEITPLAGGGAFAPLSANNIFSVGSEITHWNGNSWTIVDPLTQLSDPALASAVVFSNGEIWAGGRTIDVSSNFFSLIYRSVNNVPLFNGGTAQSWNVGRNSSNNSPGSLLLTTDADISQILTYSVVTPPAHGTLSGLPTTAITHEGSALPSGAGYTPAPGYTGTDQIVIKVAVGPVSSQTTININVLLALPVLINNYSVIKTGSSANMKWSTTSEINASEFMMERSADGMSFTTVNHISVNGTGYNYSLVDRYPLSGWNYYRLKGVDMDGRVTIFPVKSLNFYSNELMPFAIYPNPVDGKLINIRLNVTGDYTLTLYNTSGQQVMNRMVSVSTSSIQLSLPDNIIPGMYELSIRKDKTEWSEKIFIK